MASRDNASQDLLLGLLALQSGLIDQAQLLTAFETWSHAKDRSMVEILVGAGVLDKPGRTLLEGLIARYPEHQDGGPEESQVSRVAGYPERAGVAPLGEPGLSATVAQAVSVSQEGGDDPDRTSG